jgi:hypothetical protein
LRQKIAKAKPTEVTEWRKNLKLKLKIKKKK